MPELVDLLLTNEQPVLWDCSPTTASMVITGKTKRGTPVVVYTHIPNYFSDPYTIFDERSPRIFEHYGRTNIQIYLRKGAGVFHPREFEKLLEQEDNKHVYVIDQRTLLRFPKKYPIEDALAHPQTIPFLGGQERAERYVEGVQVNNSFFDRKQNEIEIAYNDDLDDHLPRVRFLHLSFVGGLIADSALTESCRIFTRKRKEQPELEQFIELAENYIAPCNKEAFMQKIRLLQNENNIHSFKTYGRKGA